MNLLLRFNLALGLVLAAGVLAAAWLCRAALEDNARRQAVSEAGLMIDSALATRTYTANEILPQLSDRMSGEFLPQSIPFYAATENFLKLREKHPNYAYKEATLNPTNPRDRAADWEADIIQRFRNDGGAQEIVGERSTPMGQSLYLARPIRAEAACLLCHSVPAKAPASMVARYGSNNGFGWQAGEVVGAQIVSVPTAAMDNAERLFRAFIGWGLAAAALVLVAANIVLQALVLRPLRQVVAVADRLSVGEMDAGEFPRRGASEIQELGRAFERMRKSLAKALKLLGD